MNTPLVIADLDGTLLHDAPQFEDRALSSRTIQTIEQLHDDGIRFAVATARPVSTGLDIVRTLHADACIYLNGALIDFDPSSSTFDSLTGRKPTPHHTLIKYGFPSQRACEICTMIVHTIPDIEIGIVMDDVRYTNFDISTYWKTQPWQYSDFTDVPEGIADKIIIFPREHQRALLSTLIPDDVDIHISEGSMWMLMAPQANKQHASAVLCDQWGIDPANTVAFGDDVIDMTMMQYAGTGVAVANANPDVLAIADQICPSNNDDGVAQWLEHNML